jgi:predicted GIY-YIG superfamily endonuclease
MTKKDLLKQIAIAGYNVGFGAKLHFSTYDIVQKTPDRINLVSLGVAVFALFIDALTVKFLSATFVVLGIAVLYIGYYKDVLEHYNEKGVLFTNLYNDLRVLYYEVKTKKSDNVALELEKLKSIEKTFNENSISKQVLFSNWYAHYKFFWQHQIDWVGEQKNFSLLKDKIPLSLSFVVALIILVSLYFQMAC